RLDPCRHALVIDLGREGRFWCSQLHELGVQLFQGLVAEAGPYVPDVMPGIVLPHGENKGTEERSAASGRREAGDHNFLSLRRLDLQPICGSPSGGVRAIGTLRHDTFQSLSLGFREEGRTFDFAMRAERDQLVARQNGFETFLALEEGLLPQVPPFLEHQVKSAVQKLRLVSQRILEQLKTRDAILSDRNKLAIDHGLKLDAFECLGNLDVAAADDFAVAAVQRDLAALDFSDHSEAVVLILEYPSGT